MEAIIISGLSLAGIYFLISFAVTFLYGVGGFPNLAIGPIGLAGAYTTAHLLRSDVNIFIALFIGVIVAVALGVLIQRVVVEPLYNSVGGGDRGRIFVIYGTFGLTLLFPALLQNVFTETMINIGAPNIGAITLFGATITGYELLSIIIAGLIFVIAHIVLNKTRRGTEVRSVTQNHTLAGIIGIKVNYIYLIVAGISAASAFIGGVLWGQIFSLDLGSGMYFTLYGFIIAVMGGLGSISGAMIVSIILGLVMSFTSYYIGGVFEPIITTIILIVIILVAPSGLVPSRREV